MKHSWNVVDLVSMVVEFCVQGTANYEEDWEIQVSVPRTLPTHEEEYTWFNDKWEEKRPTVGISRTYRFCRRGDLEDGVFVNIHKLNKMPMTRAIKQQGLVVSNQED
eukprot:10035211-Prorocentrum_lima.AAC.1